MASIIKRQPPGAADRVVLVLALGAWAAGLAAILTHPIFVTNDSVSNYGHVWYVAKVFWHGGGLPYHFPELGHGDALAFPYAFIPWLTAAFLRPLLGDWIVTLWLVLGGVGALAATAWAFPEVRAPLPLTLLLLNPLMVESVILGQLPFLWASSFWFVAIALWRRDQIAWAVIAAAVAQATHPAVVLPLAGLTVLLRLPFEPRWPRLLVVYSVSVVLALPGIVMVFLSPVVEDSTLYSLARNFLGTASLRAGVVFAPFAVLWLARRLSRAWLIGVVAAALLLNVVLVPVRGTAYAWHAFVRTPDETLVPFLDSDQFHPGETYRILRVADGKVGMYQLIQRGARLDSEFFPESIDRRSWASASEYSGFLRSRHVGEVIIYFAYDTRYQTNEHALLDQLAERGCSSRTFQRSDFEVYNIAETCP
jgi:hypothetical protein